ncbi:SAM-dependent methyltransferase [Saxibacter everestensis]|uniref:SAM-dependent methyltransferase n=1 Tax=Saxibacter everestensis TaxID=2909229 RepID=A0ABY8QVA1_9MICO|nr:SAM-dependent methyltransferase [Brevibacteriaceae bacterium ZFBP1038]
MSRAGGDAVDAEYFRQMYEADPDPWGFETSWYEQRKYALSLAMLPQARYRKAFEPGCSIGVLTRLLADRCDEVLATDVVASALQTAGSRLQDAGQNHVRFERRPAQDWPAETFDLVVFSELGYYLGCKGLTTALASAAASLEPGGTFISVHWRHPLDDGDLTGDDVRDAVRSTSGWRQLAEYTDDDVTIDVMSRDGA